MKTAVFIRAASDDDNECLETDGLMETIELVGNGGNKNKYQHLLLILEQGQPKKKTQCQVKYADMLMNRFSVRASDRFEVCGVQTVQVPNIWNSTERENDEKERKRVAGQQVRVRNIIFKIIFRVFIF